MKKHTKKKFLSAQKRKKKIITCKRIVVILYNRMHFSTFLREFFFYLLKLVKKWVVKSQPSVYIRGHWGQCPLFIIAFYESSPIFQIVCLFAKYLHNIKIYGRYLQMKTIFLDSSHLILSQTLLFFTKGGAPKFA